jgi:hypothetical protein
MLAGNLLFTGGCLNAVKNNATQSVGTESGDFRRQINHRELGFSDEIFITPPPPPLFHA